MSFCVTGRPGSTTKSRQLVFRLLLQPLLIEHTLHLPGLCGPGTRPASCGYPLLLLPLHPHGDRNTYSGALIVLLKR